MYCLKYQFVLKLISGGKCYPKNYLNYNYKKKNEIMNVFKNINIISLTKKILINNEMYISKTNRDVSLHNDPFRL